MSDLPQLLEGNRRFTAHFADGGLPIRPRLSTVVLTRGRMNQIPIGVVLVFDKSVLPAARAKFRRA